MSEEVWLTGRNPQTLIRITHEQQYRYKRGSRGRRLRLIACGFMRSAWDQLPHESVRAAVAVAEAFADKECGIDELRAAEREVSNTLFELHSPYQIACFTLLKPRHEVAVNTAMLVGFGSDFDRTCHIIRDVFGNPFRPVTFDPDWRTSTVVALARQMYDSRDFSPMPVLADALQDAGCDHPDILAHCRGDGPHVRGCWVVDGVLGRA